jgi:hypothetical protein
VFTVAGLLCEVGGLVFVAYSIWHRNREYGPRPITGAVEGSFEFTGTVDRTVDTSGLPVDERIARLERVVEANRAAAAEATTQLRAELTETSALGHRLRDVERGVRRLGLGDVRNDWKALAVVAAGVFLTFVGETLSWWAA